MTKSKALNYAIHLWGKRAIVRDSGRPSSQEARDTARDDRIRLKTEITALEDERRRRLAELTWLTDLNERIQQMRAAERAASGVVLCGYRYDVGTVDDQIGAFHVRGSGDSWEDAFRKAEEKFKPT